MICEIQALNVLANNKKIAILLISFTVVVAQNTTTTTAPKAAKNNATTAKSTVAQNNATTTTTTPKVKTTSTTTAAVDNTCGNKCLEVSYDDCKWNEEVIPGSKTDFHFERSGVCPCPGDNTKDECNVVQRRIRNIPALQAWSACLFLLSICIAGKILRIIRYCGYGIQDTINILESLLM